jgi:hypothetical protein
MAVNVIVPEVVVAVDSRHGPNLGNAGQNRAAGAAGLDGLTICGDL